MYVRILSYVSYHFDLMRRLALKISGIFRSTTGKRTFAVVHPSTHNYFLFLFELKILHANRVIGFGVSLLAHSSPHNSS